MLKTTTTMIAAASLAMASSSTTSIINDDIVVGASITTISKSHYSETESIFLIDYEKSETISDIYFITDKEDSNLIKLHSLINSYEQLPNNWDGYNGIAPEKSTVTATIAFLNVLMNQSIVSPKSMLSGSGEISLYWDNGDTYIEIGFEDKEHYTYFIDNNGEGSGEDDYPLSESIPNSLLQILKTISV
ncbi:MAG: hypothetical protein KAI79_19270 [Bacteroidales bacterium]|nr:hypothetical protein [Bacteroidales bacterium]